MCPFLKLSHYEVFNGERIDFKQSKQFQTEFQVAVFAMTLLCSVQLNVCLNGK